MSKSVMIVGVGGQGTLLASKLLGQVLLRQGYDVKVSEVHGMSQRGGSVVTYVKYGGSVASPIVNHGEADVILAFELLEAARWLPCLRPGGKLIVNTQRIDPMPVVAGAAEYPDGIAETLAAAGVDLLALDALSLALEAGSARAVNVVLLGALAQYLELPKTNFTEALAAQLKPQFVEMNLRAFAAGCGCSA